MCNHCDWQGFVEDCDRLVVTLDELPERAEGFRDSVEDKVTGMRDWAAENEHTTEKMKTAIENMAGGVARWLERS